MKHGWGWSQGVSIDRAAVLDETVRFMVRLPQGGAGDAMLPATWRSAAISGSLAVTAGAGTARSRPDRPE